MLKSEETNKELEDTNKELVRAMQVWQRVIVQKRTFDFDVFESSKLFDGRRSRLLIALGDSNATRSRESWITPRTLFVARRSMVLFGFSCF